MMPVGRPPLVKGEIRHKTSVSLTKEQQIQLRRLGGSRWLQQLLNKTMETPCPTAVTITETAIKVGTVRSVWQPPAH
jgi:hypothetical protein